MSKVLLDPRAADRLAKIAAMFGSEHAGERAAAAAKFHAFVCQLGLTSHEMFSELAEQQPDLTAFRRDWQQMAHLCGASPHLLSPREAKFIGEMRLRKRPPSEKQMAWLTDIYERIARDGRR